MAPLKTDLCHWTNYKSDRTRLWRESKVRMVFKDKKPWTVTGDEDFGAAQEFAEVLNYLLDQAENHTQFYVEIVPFLTSFNVTFYLSPRERSIMAAYLDPCLTEQICELTEF